MVREKDELLKIVIDIEERTNIEDDDNDMTLAIEGLNYYVDKIESNLGYIHRKMGEMEEIINKLEEKLRR